MTIELVLFLETLCCLAFVIPNSPVFLKKQIISWTENVTLQRGVKIYGIIASVLVFEVLVEILFTKPPKADAQHEEFHLFEADRLRNQRNALITGFSIGLIFVLQEFVSSTKNNMRMTLGLEALKKQAEGARNEYLKLLQNNEDKDKSPAESLENKLKEENKKLREEKTELQKRLEKADQQVTAIVKQSENSQETLAKLMEENKSLKNKLDDFTLVFGETQKKKV